MKINRYSASRLFYGFFSIIIGMTIVITKSIGYVDQGNPSKLSAHAEIYLGEYSYFVGGFLIVVGIIFTYRAFTKH